MPTGRRGAAATGAAAVLCVGAIVGCGTGGGSSDGDGRAEGREDQVVSVTRGTFRGVRLGDSSSRVRRLLGPARCAGGPLMPLAADRSDFSAPSIGYLDPAQPSVVPRECVMRYPRTALAVSRRPRAGVWAIVTTQREARTEAGIGIGDTVADVRARYPRSNCHEERLDDASPHCVATEVATRTSPGTPPSRQLHFGLDDEGAITSIWLHAAGPRGLARHR